MVSLGRVTAPKPVNLPSQKRENNGNDPTIPLVPKTVSSSVWGSQAGQGGGDAPPVQAPPQQAPPPAQPAQGQPIGGAWGSAGVPDRRQASALLAQDEFPTLGAPAAEPLPNGAPYAHAPQGYANGAPPSHPSMERTSWDGPNHGAPYEKSGSPGNFHSAGSWGAPTGERWADSVPPMRPAQGYGGPPPVPYGGMDGRMDMQGPPYMPSQGAGYMPFNQPPPPPPRARPPSGADPAGPRYMAAPPEYQGRPQGQHMGGPPAHGHGQGQYEGPGPMQSFGAATMAGGGYMPPHLRNRDRGEGMPRPTSEWSIAAQPSESLPDEVPQQTTPPKILRRDVPAASHPVHQAGPPPQQQQQQQQPPVQHHRGEGHHRGAHGGMPPHPDLAAMQPMLLQPQHPQHAHQHPHHHSQQRPHAPPVQAHGAPQQPRLSVPQQQPPPPPQQQPQSQPQQQQQPGVQRLQFGQLGSPPGYSRDGEQQQPLPAGLHLPNGHMSQPQPMPGPVGRLQHQHSSGGQGFSPKVAQQLGLHRPESAQDVPGSADGQSAQSNGPIMTFGQPAQRPQHQPAAHSTRPPSAPDAPAPKAAPAEAAQPAALSELEAQKAYMRQKVQQRQQEAAKQQQQPPAVGQRSASEASRRSMLQSVAQQEPAEAAEQPIGGPGPSGPGRGRGGQGPGRGGRGHDAGRGRGQSRRDVQHARAPEAQALDKAVPQSLSLSPSEQLIMEAKMRSLSLEANKAAGGSGPPSQRQQQHQQSGGQQHQQHGGQHQQQHQHQQQQQQARAEHGSAPPGGEGGSRRGSASAREGQPKAVPIVTATREPSHRRDAPGSSQQQRRPAAVPIAVPVPERRAQAEGRPSGEGPPQQREQRGARREKRTRDRPPQSGEAAPPEGSQAPAESRQAPPAAAEAGGFPPQEQTGGGPPGAHRRGSRRGGGGQRGERSGGQGPPGVDSEGASKAVDAPPGLGGKQQEPAPHAAEDQHAAPAERGEQNGESGGADRRDRRDRPRRERGQRERPPRHLAAIAGNPVVVDSDVATEGKGSEPAEGDARQSGAREARRTRPGERAPKKPRSATEHALGQTIHAPPGLGGPTAQPGLPDVAFGQEASRRARGERELYHPPVKEATGPSQEAHAEADADAPLQMTDGKPPGLGRSRARHGRERRDRRRPPSGASDMAGGEHTEQGPPHEGGEQPEGAADSGAQAEDGPRQRQHRGPGSRGSRGGSGGSRAKGGAEGTPAPADGAQEGSSNAQAGDDRDHQEGLPQRSNRSGRGRGPRGGARNRGSQDGAPADAGEAGLPDGEAGKTLEVARGTVDAKGKRVWTVKDKAAEAAAEKPSTAEAGLSSST
ncbi:g2672 [Coccomyxa viridis]|uniref:G2672 protein n=1 Tax=Coccomyxa viridis TaxID=1274662 RepID=A0ABP1FKY5_9CHLO